MRAALATLMSAGLVVLALTGCAQADSDPTTGDGLHSTVPNVVGMPVGDATTALEDAGYEVGSVRPEGATGDVLEQEPAAGYSAPRGATVDLVVAE